MLHVQYVPYNVEWHGTMYAIYIQLLRNQQLIELLIDLFNS